MNYNEMRAIMLVVQAEHQGFISNHETSEGNIKVQMWLEEFGGTSPAILLKAVKEHLRHNQYPPKICEIREQISRLLLGDLPSPERAWTLAQNAVGSLFSGCTDAVERLPAPIRQAVREIGAWEIRNSTSPDQLGKTFAAIYTNAVKSAMTDATTLPNQCALPEPKNQENCAKVGQLIKFVANARGI